MTSTTAHAHDDAMDVDAEVLDLTLRLPNETVSVILGFLDLKTLVRGSLVCKRWRDTAFAHRTYWQEVEVDDAVYASAHGVELGIELAVAQLTRSRAEPVTLKVALRKPPSNAQLLVNAIADNLDRINDLIIGVDVSMQHLLEATLARPAPRLEIIAIELYGASPHSTMLRQDFLGGHAPRLNQLILRNIQMPAVPMPHLAHLPELALVSLQSKHPATASIPPPQSLVFPSQLFAHFPNLVQLELNAYPFFTIPDTPDPLLSAGLARLSRLHFWNSPPAQLLQWPELASIGKLTMYEPEHHLFPHVIKHLPGELGFATDHVHGHQFLTLMTTVTMYELMPERRKNDDAVNQMGYPAEVHKKFSEAPVKMQLRKFLFDREECVVNPGIIAAFQAGGLFERLALLAVPAFYLPGLTMHMRDVELPALREIVIRTRGDLFDLPGGGFAKLPALERVVFESGRGAREPFLLHEAEDIFDLLQLLVPEDTYGKFELELYRVAAVNFTDEVKARAEKVVRRLFYTPGTVPPPFDYSRLKTWNIIAAAGPADEDEGLESGILC